MRKTAARLAVIVLAGGTVTGGSVASAHGSCTGALIPSQGTVTQNNEVGVTGAITCQWEHDLYNIGLVIEYRTPPGTGAWNTMSFSRDWTDANSSSVTFSRSRPCPSGSVREWHFSMHWTAGDGAHSGDSSLTAVVVCL